jgi:hypothetical protein
MQEVHELIDDFVREVSYHGAHQSVLKACLHGVPHASAAGVPGSN